MDKKENWLDRQKAKQEFAPNTVEEQIESVSTADAQKQSQPVNTRLIHDLSTLEREDATSVDRIWQRLSSHEAFDKRSQFTQEAVSPQKGSAFLPSHTTHQRWPYRKYPGIIATAACLVLLVGSLAVVLNIVQNSRAGGGVGLCTSTGKDTTTPAPVVYKDVPGQTGLYVTGSQGVSRLDIYGGQPQPLWTFKMNACTTVTPTIVSRAHSSGFIPTPRIFTGSVVANDMLFFGVSEESGVFLYALHTHDGSFAWKAQVGVSATPLVLDGLVVIQTADTSGNPVILALDASNGSIRWSHPISASTTNQSEGLGSVGDGRVYASTSNALFALDITNGQQVWSTEIESNQIISGTRYYDGTLYATASSTCNNCASQFGTASGAGAAYAFNPATGKKLWESRKVAGYFSPPTETQGVVYFGSIDGSILALRANDGSQLWQSSVNSEVRVAPLVADGLVFVEAEIQRDPDHGSISGQFVVFDTAGQLKGTFDPDAIDFSDAASSISVAQRIVYVSGDSNDLYQIQASTLQVMQRYPITALRSGSDVDLIPTVTLVP